MMRLVYAANRAIGVHALALLQRAGIEPVALLVPDGAGASRIADMRAALDSAIPIIEGTSFKSPTGLARLATLSPDYILSVHYPYLFPQSVITISKIGVLNLHPAFLPFNRGWHTPSWAIIDQTPIGATLHWVDENVDAGDIALQRLIDIRPSDTADSLYQRLLQSELDLLEMAIPLLKTNQLPRQPQQPGGSAHRKMDLAAIQQIDLMKSVRADDLLNLLRGLTTNNPEEAAYFVKDGRRYRIRVDITEANSADPLP